MKDLADEVLRARKPKRNPCPNCGVGLSKVKSTHQRSIKSRYTGTRRLRECLNCHTMFSTVEIIETDYRRLVDVHEFNVNLMNSFVRVPGFINSIKRLDDE